MRRKLAPLPLALVRKASADDFWNLGNTFRYDLCRAYPRHDADDAITAKVWLIGRSYAAALERRRPDGQATETDMETAFYPRAAKEIRKARVDRFIEHASRPDPQVEDLLVCHRRLMDVFRTISRQDKRSRAAKYLHFHVPERFNLYDSGAAVPISRVCPPVGRLTAYTDPTAADRDTVFAAFHVRAGRLRLALAQRVGADIAPRKLDNVLLEVARRLA